MAKASAAQTLLRALAFKGTPFRVTWVRARLSACTVLQNPFTIEPVLQSACCLCQTPLVESVSLASGVSHCRGVTYCSLPWSMGALEFPHPLQFAEKSSPENVKLWPARQALADVGSPLNANGASGVITLTQPVNPPKVGLL